MDDASERVEEAEDLAQDIAPELDAVLVTIYPDAETLDTIHPGDTDLATANAIARAVAVVMADAGVEVFVQRADRGAFRRWLAEQEDRPGLHRHWVDRGRLLRGADAFRALGLPAPPADKPPRFPTAPGPTADRLLAAYWGTEDDGEFDALMQSLITAGREDVLELALRKVRAQQSEENAIEMRAAMLLAAGGAAIGPAGWAELVALPVALPAGSVPDAIALAKGLVASGCLMPEEELRFLPGWRSPDAMAALSPMATRRALLDLVAGEEPRDLPPGDTDDLTRHGFGVLVGLRIDWDIPVWDVIAAEGDLPEEPPEDEETPEERARMKRLDHWRAGVAAEMDGCLPLDLVPLPVAGAVIAGFLEEVGGQFDGLEEIRTFVDIARGEAGGEDVVCCPAIVGENLELALYTTAGRFLDRLVLPPDRLPARAEEMDGLLGAFVRLVRAPPGH